MITFTHGVIRTAEPDDAWDLVRLYDARRPRAAFLGRNREVIIPGEDEMREILRPDEGRPQVFYAIEDTEGVIRGYGGKRSGSTGEAHYGELLLYMHDDEDLETPLAQEAWQWLLRRAFMDELWRKAVANVLDSEPVQRAWFLARGFESCGVQREMLYTGGRWLHSETLVLYNRDIYPGMGQERDAQ